MIYSKQSPNVWRRCEIHCEKTLWSWDGKKREKTCWENACQGNEWIEDVNQVKDWWNWLKERNWVRRIE